MESAAATAAELNGLPQAFRALLKRPTDEARAAFALRLELFNRLSREGCSARTEAECAALAAEAAALGGPLALDGARRVRTAAQAASFVGRWSRFIAARERMGTLAPGAQLDHAMPQGIPSWEMLLKPAYVKYDTARFDFRGLILRMFDGIIRSGDGQAHSDVDPLARLHLTPLGASERGYARIASLLTSELHLKPSPLDQATRYGCGLLNQVFKTSHLLPDFMVLYRDFIRCWVAPQLGVKELLFQARPIFRVLLPEHLAVGPRHCDSAYHSQPNEINYWLPFTDVFDTNSLQVESVPGAGDFEPITCGYGCAYRFFGNGCEHLTELNVSGATRVSLDFRVIRSTEEAMCPVEDVRDELTARGEGGKGARNYFRVGRYYERLRLD